MTNRDLWFSLFIDYRDDRNSCFYNENFIKVYGKQVFNDLWDSLKSDKLNSIIGDNE